MACLLAWNFGFWGGFTVLVVWDGFAPACGLGWFASASQFDGFGVSVFVLFAVLADLL